MMPGANRHFLPKHDKRGMEGLVINQFSCWRINNHSARFNSSNLNVG